MENSTVGDREKKLNKCGLIWGFSCGRWKDNKSPL